MQSLVLAAQESQQQVAMAVQLYMAPSMHLAAAVAAALQ
jgi:hypothetical protein